MTLVVFRNQVIGHCQDQIQPNQKDLKVLCPHMGQARTTLHILDTLHDGVHLPAIEIEEQEDLWFLTGFRGLSPLSS